MVLLQIVVALHFMVMVESPAVTEMGEVEALRAELLRMEEDDQEVLARFDAAPHDPGVIKEVDEVLARNTTRLEQIVARYGWPTRSMVGEEASRAAFLIIQHADHDRRFQKEVLALFESLVETGEVAASHFAYLWDRTHEPQRYGTQGGCVERGSWAPRLIEDPSGVEERRAAVGLPPLSLYVEMGGQIVCGEWSPEPYHEQAAAKD